MKHHLLLTMPLLLSLAALSGCATRGDFTAISSKNVNLSNIKIDKSMSLGRTKGEDCLTRFLFIPSQLQPPMLKEALDRALETKKANLLIDAVVKWDSFNIPLIYGETCWKVEGEAYDTYK